MDGENLLEEDFGCLTSGFRGFRSAPRDDDHRRTQAAIVEQVADLIDLKHGAGRDVGIFLLHDGLMMVRVERLADGIDACDAVALEGSVL